MVWIGLALVVYALIGYGTSRFLSYVIEEVDLPAEQMPQVLFITKVLCFFWPVFYVMLAVVAVKTARLEG